MKKAISIFLSILMLASSSGMAYSQHFCGGLEMMSEITLGEKLLSCGMETNVLDSDCGGETTTHDSHDCCKNHITKIHTDDNFAKASFNLKLNKTFVATFISVFVLQEVEITSTEKTFFADYNPPPLEQDLNILYDTFLI
ncbi:hypothetical protein Aeqsu_0552 [Aequorivita sublithincola DSM 14238]|uniref:Secreted protein n=1 Tax=Aequorivita sublithincola (strain DSM 14238 / LMG 21431 / ACAM 643 / 9-3) TaxID=746697 RepID=I3YSU5_AEQSU|nr:hypothetical protein [Aequorivita sublithincola]AFL80063.1 hypothetical protein Aeqsu_0552 [Aequorivita sublithincola DSM 14238]